MMRGADDRVTSRARRDASVVARLLIACGVALSFFVGGALTVGAQEAPAARIVAGVPVGAELAAYQRVVEDALIVVLDRLGYESSVGEGGGRGAVDAAPPLGTHLRYEYALLPLLPRLHVSLAVYDEANDLHLVTVTERARANVTLYNSIDTLVEAADAIVAPYVRDAAARTGAIQPLALVGALPSPAVGDGEVLTVQPRAPLVLDETFVLADGVALDARLDRRDRYPVQFPLGAGDPPRGTPRRRFGAQAHYSLQRLAGAGIGSRYYVVPDRLIVSGEFDVWLTGLVGGGAYTVVHLEPRLLFGVVALGSPTSLFQVELSSGVGLLTTVFTTGLVAPYLDVYWNVANVALNVQTGPMIWFARSGFSYVFPSDRGFLGPAVSSRGWNPSITVGTVVRW